MDISTRARLGYVDVRMSVYPYDTERLNGTLTGRSCYASHAPNGDAVLWKYLSWLRGMFQKLFDRLYRWSCEHSSYLGGWGPVTDSTRI